MHLICTLLEFCSGHNTFADEILTFAIDHSATSRRLHLLPRRLYIPQSILNHSLAASLTSPIFNLGEYFFSTDSLWYWEGGHELAGRESSSGCLTEPEWISDETRRNKYLPELLGCILSSDALEDLRTTGVLVDEVGHIVDAAVDDDIHALVGAVVGGDIGRGERLRHDGKSNG